VSSGRLSTEYVLPLRWYDTRQTADLTDYLRELTQWLDVTVVDGSPPQVFALHHARWAGCCRHVAPEPWPGGNGKVGGVITGLRLARHEAVIIADDDVRWERSQLEEAVSLLQHADLVRPQNYFAPCPWHARWDTGRTLLNRALGADYPGTYVVRRSTFLRMGGYAGDVLFENLELSRTVRAAGGHQIDAKSLLVQRRPPTARHFLGQRVRQAYDDLAQPGRLAAEAAVLPVLLVWLGRVLKQPEARFHAALHAACAVAVIVGVAEVGRRRYGGTATFPSSSALWAPMWLLERAVCVWLALARRLTGGMPYGGQRLVTAAHSSRLLRRQADVRAPLAMITKQLTSPAID
jgi:hypothetical protein